MFEVKVVIGMSVCPCITLFVSASPTVLNHLADIYEILQKYYVGKCACTILILLDHPW